MKDIKIILASASPRRRELLAQAGFEFEVITSDVDEVVDPRLTPEMLVMSLAKQKAQAVAVNYEDCVVIGSDTVVVLDGRVLGKPRDEADAVSMLESLSGRTHEVYTGVCIAYGGETHCFFECTRVKFCKLEAEQIKAYVETKEPMDKAGAYGIQGKGCVLVEGIEGDYFNVVGFPVSRFCREYKKLVDKQ